MNIKRNIGYILSLHGQVVRRQSCKLKIVSSILTGGFFSRFSSVGRALDCNSINVGIHRSLVRFQQARIGAVAQMVERLLSMREVGGSMPPCSNIIQYKVVYLLL